MCIRTQGACAQVLGGNLVCVYVHIQMHACIGAKGQTTNYVRMHITREALRRCSPEVTHAYIQAYTHKMILMHLQSMHADILLVLRVV